MSVDTYLYVDPKKFEVWSCTASCVCNHKRHHLTDQKQTLLGMYTSLEKAVKAATKYDIHNPMDVEYGINLYLWCK